MWWCAWGPSGVCVTRVYVFVYSAGCVAWQGLGAVGAFFDGRLRTSPGYPQHCLDLTEVSGLATLSLGLYRSGAAMLSLWLGNL